MRLFLAFFVAMLLHAADVHAVVPKNVAPPIGPYSPGVFTGNYLYVSGQGARDPAGQLPLTFDAQVRQTLENVKSVVTAAGLGMNHIVYAQVYLEDMTRFDEMNKIYAEYFPAHPPARATLGVARLPGTPIEINAVAVRDASQIKSLSVPGLDPDEPVSPGILTEDRLFISAMRGADPASSSEQQVESALDRMTAVVRSAGLSMAHIVFVNPYLTTKVPMQIMNSSYAKRFEFGNTPARATIEVSSLPGTAQVEFTGVAVRDIGNRVAVRPDNMPPSPTASPCVFAGDTLYCSAKSGFIPGLNGGVFAESVENQLRQTMRNLLDNLEKAGLTFDNVVSTNVYLDDLGDFAAMNKIYAKYFRGIYPARTTIQQIAPVLRKKNSDDTYPDLEQISLVAVKPGTRRN